MILPAQQPCLDPDASLADQIRRANACREMADVLQGLALKARVPDTRWMAQVASEVLLNAASNPASARHAHDPMLQMPAERL